MADDSDAPKTDSPTPPPAPDAATQPVANLVQPGSQLNGEQDGDPGDWQPPQTDAQGFAIDGHGLPINLHRRAMVLADQDADEDPAGAVAPEAIADARDRLAAYDDQYPPLQGMTRAAMEALDEAQSLTFPDDAKVNDVRDIIAAARPPRI